MRLSAVIFDAHPQLRGRDHPSTKQCSHGGDQPVGLWFQNNRSPRPLPEGAVDAPAMEDERYAPVRKTAADRRAVGGPQLEIQRASRQIRMIRELQGAIQSRSGENTRACCLQTFLCVEADQGLVLNKKDASTG